MTIDDRGLAYETIRPDGGLVDTIVSVTGRPDEDAVIELIRRIRAEPWCTPGISLVLDFSACDPGPTLNAEGARELAARLNDALDHSLDSGFAVAIVATGASAFGTLRMTLSFQEIDAERDAPLPDDFPIRAFDTREAALAWLADVRAAAR